MRKPNDLVPGERILLEGFRDYAKDKYKFNRTGTFIKQRPCGYEIRFDKGYTEHWSYENLFYALNGAEISSNVPEKYKTLEAHVKALCHG